MTSQYSQYNNIAAIAKVKSPQRTNCCDLEQILKISTPNWRVQVLGRSVSVLVPTTVDANVPADTSFYVEEAKQFMAELFEGAGAFEQEGLYTSSQWGIIREEIVVVRSFTTNRVLEKNFPLILGFLQYLQNELRQEAMGLEIDGKLLIIQF